MRTEEKVIAALRGLPPIRQAEVLDFAEFLSMRQAVAAQPGPDGCGAREPQVTADFDAFSLAEGEVFPPTTLEAPDAPVVYQGMPLTLTQMREAIEINRLSGETPQCMLAGRPKPPPASTNSLRPCRTD